MDNKSFCFSTEAEVLAYTRGFDSGLDKARYILFPLALKSVLEAREGAFDGLPMCEILEKFNSYWNSASEETFDTFMKHEGGCPK
jgi:hypothetical protein